MLKKLQNILDFLLEIVIPERKDFKIIKNLNEQSIIDLPKAVNIEDMPWITSLFRYKNASVRAIIWELKYRGTTLPLEHIGRLLYEEIIALASDIAMFDAEAKFLLIPIPISEKRRSERGYNQSEYIARSVVGCDSGRVLLYAPQWFEKTRDTLSQSHSASREERLRNLSGCFVADPRVAGYHVFLIDDVVTTGTTLSEARHTILTAGATSVHAFTIAH